jgi:DNA polymerase-4
MAYAERNAHTAGQNPTPRTGRFRTLSLCRSIASCADPSDDAIVPHEHVEKSISRDMTFGTDTADSERVAATLYYLAERCCKTLRQDELAASTVTVRVRFADFTTVQKQATLPIPSSNEEDIYAVARRLLALLSVPGQLVRLVGVKVSGLSAAEGAQLDLGVTSAEKFSTLHRRLDGLQSRYGYGSIRWGITCGVAERREERE